MEGVIGLEDFQILEINDQIFSRIAGKSYKVNCPIPLSDLRYLQILHKDLNGKTLNGEMICNVKIAESVLDIFQRLFEASYPIEKVRLIDEYDADDELSMRDNNSSSFNFRFVSFTNRISLHGYGMAVDINPRYNPYIKIVDGEKIISPENSVEFEDRSKNFPYKIDENDLCYKLFRAHGFEWGGSWNDSKDYQHFYIEVAGR